MHTATSFISFGQDKQDEQEFRPSIQIILHTSYGKGDRPIAPTAKSFPVERNPKKPAGVVP
jgi:hypothetical protein